MIALPTAPLRRVAICFGIAIGILAPLCLADVAAESRRLDTPETDAPLAKRQDRVPASASALLACDERPTHRTHALCLAPEQGEEPARVVRVVTIAHAVGPALTGLATRPHPR